MNGLVGLLFAESEERIFVRGSTVGDGEVHEATGITFQNLRETTFDVIQLHLRLNVFLVWRVKSDEETPLIVSIDVVGHDLARSKLRCSFKHFYRLILGCRVNVPHRGFTNQREHVRANPTPVDSRVLDLDLGNFLRSVHVEHLDNGSLANSSADSNDVPLLVHKDTVSLHVSSVDFEAL